MARRAAAWASLASLLLALLLLAGCGQAPFVTPGQDAQGRYVIELHGDNRFEPRRAQVPLNATVAWKVVAGYHDVSEAENRFTSTTERPLDEDDFPIPLGPGEEYVHVMDEPGTFTIWCHIHHEERMKMLLKVEG